MAGGKLSPRQKMINMMYLVLTALLALNVSAEILEAFQSLRDSLRTSATKFQAKNDETRSQIIAKVEEEIEQGNHKNEIVKQLAGDISKKSNETIMTINNMIEVLEKIGEKNPETGEITNKKDTENNYRFWMFTQNEPHPKYGYQTPVKGFSAGDDNSNGGRGAGYAHILKDALNGYVDWANDFIAKYDTGKTSGIEFKPICLDPKDDPAVTNPEAKEKTWEYFTFHGKPVIADLAMLEKFKLDVSEIEYELFGYLKQRLGAVKFKIDSLIAVDAPVSQVVAAGMKFETKLFVAMSSSEITPEFHGPGIKTDPGGNSATMTLNADGKVIPQGKNEGTQSYSAIIKVPTADGGYEELPIKGEFTVRKPEVVITSAAVQLLYFQCGNPLNVDVPALGDLYSPDFSGSQGGQVVPSESDKRKVLVIPTAQQFVLSVYTNTNGQHIKVADVPYKVVKPPKPDLELYVNGKQYNGAAPIPKKSSCTLKVVPDADFARALPRDARYSISSVDILAQRSLGAPTRVNAINSAGRDATGGIPVNLGSSLQQDPPGTKIYFKVGDVYRINFQGKQVKESFSDRDLYIGAVIK